MTQRCGLIRASCSTWRTTSCLTFAVRSASWPPPAKFICAQARTAKSSGCLALRCRADSQSKSTSSGREITSSLRPICRGSRPRKEYSAWAVLIWLTTPRCTSARSSCRSTACASNTSRWAIANDSTSATSTRGLSWKRSQALGAASSLRLWALQSCRWLFIN